MKPRISLIVIFVVAIPVLLFTLIAAGRGGPGTNPATTQPSDTANGQTEHISEPPGEKAPQANVTETDETGLSSEQDGRTLLQAHCAQCHSVKLLERSNMPRAQWESTLTRMETHTGHLSDVERATLLDYLAAPDKP